MTNAEIDKEIEKVKNNKFLPESVKAIEIAELESKRTSGKSSTKKEYTEFEREVTDLVVDELEIPNSDAQGMVEAKESELRGFFEKGSSAKSAFKKVFEKSPSEKKKSSVKKETKNPVKKQAKKTKKAEYMVGDKKLQEVDCEELYAQAQQRLNKAKSSEKKYRTKPVIEKVGHNIVQAASQAMKNVPIEKIKDDPEKWAKKFEALKKAAEKFAHETQSILGEDYDAAAIKEEFKPMVEFIKMIKEKYGK